MDFFLFSICQFIVTQGKKASVEATCEDIWIHWRRLVKNI